jgi:hypothetical protein
MGLNPCLASLALGLCLAAASARAEDCPAKSTMTDDIIAALSEAPGCERAMKVFEACEYGTSGDIRFGALVETKCERDFLPRLTALQKQHYQSEMRACERKYLNKEGTMYRSFTAFCRAGVAQRYAQKARRTATPSQAR